jgi:hypothetical protein
VNIRDYILQHGPDTDLGTLADGYVKEVLALGDPAEQHAALVPAVRSMVSTVASSLRKARRSEPVQTGNGSQRTNGGPAQTVDDSQRDGGRPAGATREPWLAWLTDNSRATYWIPGGGGKKLVIDVTPDEFDRRAEWLENGARGMAKQAAHCHDLAAFLRARGVTCGRELL